MQNNSWFQQKIFLVSVVIASIVVTALAIYLTPLKHFNLVEPKIDDITSEEFYELYQADPDKYIFIDVRSQESYDRLHATGSTSMPLHTLYNQRHALPKQDKEIVLICSGGVASGVGYHYLEHHGFFNIKRIEGGIETWQAAGLPVEHN